MKKLCVFLLSLLLLTPVLADAPALTDSDFTLRLSADADAAVYTIGDPAEALLAALAEYTGAPVAMTFEDQDCMLPGMTREYLTADERFVIATRPLPGDAQANTLESVMVLAPEIVTHRGAHVGMTRAEVEALYGTDYALDYDTAFYSNDVFAPQLMFFYDTETWTVTAWMIFRNMVI